MVSSQWKKVELLVARILGGKRSWDTDHDVIVVTEPGPFSDEEIAEMTGAELARNARRQRIAAWSIEVKNLTAPTVATLERFLEKNAQKAAADGMKNALVIKRKAGRGRPTPYLLVVPLEVPDGD